MKASRSLAAIGIMLGYLCAGAVGCAGGHTDHDTGSSASAHAAAPQTAHVQKGASVSPSDARKMLVEGNTRFATGRAVHPRQDSDRRTALANTQHPFAVILGCADSRTGPETLFDQGLGDLFIVREAGNVVDDHAIGSIEYAVEHLHSPLVVVLGHMRCGAVAAARDTLAARGHAPGHIESLVASLRPAVEATAGQDAEATCKANVRNVVRALRSSEPILRHMVDGGEVAVVGAYYNLDTGMVTFLED